MPRTAPKLGNRNPYPLKLFTAQIIIEDLKDESLDFVKLLQLVRIMESAFLLGTQLFASFLTRLDLNFDVLRQSADGKVIVISNFDLVTFL